MRPPIALSLLLAACSKPAAPPPAPPPPPPGPAAPRAAGCERDLSGMWRHAGDPRYAWHIADDKVTVVFHPLAGGEHQGHGEHAHHQAARDEKARIALTRKGGSLVGSAESRAPTQDGKTECDVSFRTWALSCSDSEMVLSMENSYAVGEDCQRAGGPGGPDMVEHRLVRSP